MIDRAVVDCNVIAKVFLDEPGHSLAKQLFERFENSTIELIAPDTLELEFKNLLSKRVRRKELARSTAEEIVLSFDIVRPQFVHWRLLDAKAMELSCECQASYWDSLYAALALYEGCPLITADERLQRGGLATVANIINMEAAN